MKEMRKGEPETGQVYDWDSEAKYEDESYLTPERLEEVWKELHPDMEDDSACQLVKDERRGEWVIKPR